MWKDKRVQRDKKAENEYSAYKQSISPYKNPEMTFAKENISNIYKTA